MKLVYDIESKPKGLDIANLVKMYEQHHIVFWDSQKGGTKPKLYEDDGVEAKLLVVDLEGKELDFERYSQEFAEEEFWDKELHKCKNSPIYFFTNYGTTVWPAKSSDIQAYLKSIGLSSVMETDSKKAEEAWKKQKEATAKAMDKVTMELIKERKAVIDMLKEEYNVKVLKYEELLKDDVRLVDSNNVPLPDKKRIINLVEKSKNTYQ